MTSGQLQTRFVDAEDSPGLLLWRVSNSWQADIRKCLAPHGITHVQFVLLASLAWLDAEQPVTQAALATFARLDPMMTSQVLRTLERKGLVTRTRDPSDRRAWNIRVTDAGLEIGNRATADVERADQEYFSALAEERDTFASMLRTLAAQAQGTGR